MTREVLAKGSSTGGDGLDGVGLGRNGLGSRTATQSSAAARSYEDGLDGRCAAEVWSWYSPFPREAGIAGRRFTMLAPKLANVPLLLAIGECAVEGHHAAGSLIEPYLRSRIARINETLRDMEKAEERETDRDRPLHRLNVAAAMGRLGLEVRG